MNASTFERPTECFIQGVYSGCNFAVGDKVWWNDLDGNPADDLGSGYYKITLIDDEEITPYTIVRLESNECFIVEAYVKDLSPVSPSVEFLIALK